MASISVEGFDSYFGILNRMEKSIDKIAGRSLHPGAAVVANDCKARLEALKTDDTLFRISEKFGALRAGPTKRQKKFLIESMGIAKIRKINDGWDVKLGFDGYNDIKSDRWPNGQPNAMIARSVNKGTSFMERQPFMDRAIHVSRYKVIQAIERQFTEEIEKIWDKK